MLVTCLEDVATTMRPAAAALHSGHGGHSVVVRSAVRQPDARVPVEKVARDGTVLRHRALEHRALTIAVDPELPLVRLAEIADDDGKAGAVALKPWTREEFVAHRVDDVLRDGGGGDDVAGEGGAREVHALAGEPLRLTVQGQSVGKPVDEDLAHERVAEDAPGHDEIGPLWV